MGKKTLPNNRKTNAQPIGDRSKRNLNNSGKSDTLINLSKKKIPQLIEKPKLKEGKNEVCSICLNQIKVSFIGSTVNL